MMNVIAIEGRLVRDPEKKTAFSGTVVTSFAIAHETGWGEKKKTSFTPCVAFGQTAEFIDTYFSKGKAVLITGKLVLDQWEDAKTGDKKSRHKIEVSEASFCGEKQDESEY